MSIFNISKPQLRILYTVTADFSELWLNYRFILYGLNCIILCSCTLFESKYLKAVV